MFRANRGSGECSMVEGLGLNEGGGFESTGAGSQLNRGVTYSERSEPWG